ncbi:hypothetical protein FOZ62_002432 [Perkinsus olseni]|uniref:Ankyrin Repeat n=1 Tax=Perkinsus olseni TaxID=32597 RepID=A0A7J6Q467_PEROL|nr:hypothetical protein FOZ62_002432 [Perkinsus olseni]
MTVTTLIWESIRSRDTATLRCLLEEGVFQPFSAAPNFTGTTALHLAAEVNNHDAALLLILHRADVNAREFVTVGGRTPLHVAANEGSVSVAELLLKYGAEVEARDKRGFTPLATAAVSNQAAAMRLLLANGAHCEARDNEGHNPLWWAENMGATKAVEVLSGAPWNSVARCVTQEEQTGHVLKSRQLLGMKPLVVPKKKGKKKGKAKGKAKGKGKASKKK